MPLTTFSPFSTKFLARAQSVQESVDNFASMEYISAAFKILKLAHESGGNDAAFLAAYRRMPLADTKTFFGYADNAWYRLNAWSANDLRARASAYALLALSSDLNGLNKAVRERLQAVLQEKQINCLDDVRHAMGTLLVQMCNSHHKVSHPGFTQARPLNLYHLILTEHPCNLPGNIVLHDSSLAPLASSHSQADRLPLIGSRNACPGMLTHTGDCQRC